MVVGGEIEYWLEQISKMGKYSTQPAFTCLKLTLESLEQVVKYVQS